MTQSLDDMLREADPDRWASSRFIQDPSARADVVALYAFDHGLERVPASVSQPLLGEIRLAWWREAIDDLFEGRPPRSHPALEALAAPIAAGRFVRETLQDLIEARVEALEDCDGTGVVARLGRTCGAVTRLAVRRLSSDLDPAVVETVEAAGRAWGGALLVRRATKAESVDDRLRDATRRDLAAARACAGSIPVGAFPAAAHASLAAAYLAGRSPSDIEKRLRMTWAVATGRL